MSLTTRQKKIINPYAESTNIEGSNGEGYDFSDRRNKFVLDAIHESYLSFYKFPNEGTILNVDDISQERKTITQQDLQAYCALHPQNGKYNNSEIQIISDQEAEDRLQIAIINVLQNNSALDKYTSPTTELTYSPEYEEKQSLANLISIPADNSNAYKNKLRSSLGLPSIQESPDIGLDSLPLDPIASTYVGSDTNVDIYDWRNNCKPGDPPERVYYNPSDAHYYFVKRTDTASVRAYALNFILQRVTELGGEPEGIEDIQAYRQNLWSGLPQNDSRKQNWDNAYTEGVNQILQLTGKYSSDNVGRVKERVGIAPNAVLSYKDIRPGSRWVYAVRIPAAVVNILPDSQDFSLPSYEDLELSPLEKAKRIVGSENTSKSSFTYRVEELLQYLPTTRLLLREYNEKLNTLGVNPSDISGIDLSREVDRLTSFMDFLALFCSYNKITLEDKDQVEFFLSDQYVLDHICINGVFYDRGCGNSVYSDLETGGASVVNAFSLMTPTTFSILENSYNIQLEYIETTTSTRTEVFDFLSTYIIPTINVDEIKASKLSEDSTLRQKTEKRRHLFQELSRLSTASPAEYELLFSNRDLTYKISSTLTGIDCDTGQAKAAKYALKFYQAATGKTKLQSLIRETILLIRNELIRDLVEREVISRESASYANEAARVAATNPDQILKYIENYVDQQIYCSLDVLGDFIQDSFLDPLGAPPVANSLVRKTLDTPNLKLEFKKNKMVSLKAETGEIYRRAIKTLIYNFLKSLVAGVAKDIVEALLGCGPDGVKGRAAEELAASAKRYDFGYAELESLTATINIVAIAEKAGLNNQSGDGVISAPRLVQIQQIMSDTSKMCTPTELQLLLDGDASSDLLDHLLENYTSNRILNFASSEVDGEVIYESLDSRIYSEIVFTKEKIIDFFDKLGDAVDGTAAIGELPYNSPLEVYCTSREPNTSPLTLQFPDPGELESQYLQIADSRINKINNLCGWLRGMTNIQLELDRLISNLPIMTWYTDFLEFLEWLSFKIFDYLAEKWAKLWEQDPIDNSMLPYNMYHSKMGVELFFQIFLELTNMPISEVRAMWSPPGRDNLFPVFATPPGFGSVPALAKRGARSDNEVAGSNTIGSAFVRTGIEHPDVNSYIWSFQQYEGSQANQDASRRAPLRLRLPQYIMPIQRTYETYDVGYYAMRNAPAPLTDQLQRTFTDPIVSTRTPNQRDVLSHNAEHVLDFLSNERTDAPYIGYAGYSWLSCWDNSLGGIRVHFRQNPNQSDLPLLASYKPMESEFYTETTNYQIGVEGNLPDIDYRIFNYGEEPLVFGDNSISTGAENELIVNNVTLPSLADASVKRLYGNFSIGNETADAEDRSIPYSSRPFALRCINNYGERIEATINNVVTSNVGRRRLPKYIAALNRPCLSETDDDCVTKEDIKRAAAGIASVQTRIQKFLVNVLPCARIYGAWGSMGTTMLLIDYLHRKILHQLKQREILGTFGESLDFIKDVYPHDPSDSRFASNPIILNDNSVEENLKNVIESVFRGVLKNIDKYSEYFVSDSLFAGNSFVNYKYTLSKFYQAIRSDIGQHGRSYGIEAENRQQVIQIFDSFILNEEDVTELGLKAGAYYMPIAFQVASYLIYYDHGLKFGDRYSDTYYRAEVEIASADDSLLSAIARREINKFSNLFTGYPVSVKMWDRNREIRYFNQSQTEERLSSLTAIQDELLRQSQRFLAVPELRQIEDGNPQAQVSQYLQSYLDQIRLSLRGNQNDLLEFDPIKRGYPRDGQEILTYDFVHNRGDGLQLSNLQSFVASYINAPGSWLRGWRNFATNSAQDFAENPLVLGTGLELSHYPVYQNIPNAPVFPSEEEIRAWWSSNEDIIVQSVLLEIENLMSDYIQWLSGTTDRANLQYLRGARQFGNLDENLQRSRIAGYSQIIPTEFTSQQYYAVLAYLGSSWTLAAASTWLSLDSNFVEDQLVLPENQAQYNSRGLMFLTLGTRRIVPIWFGMYLRYKVTLARENGLQTDPQLLASVIDWWVATAATGFFANFTNTQYDSWGNIVNYSKIDQEKTILDGLINTNE